MTVRASKTKAKITIFDLSNSGQIWLSQAICIRDMIFICELIMLTIVSFYKLADTTEQVSFRMIGGK